MSDPMVSIIIPVYNAEQTIERCLTSIRNQTYKNFEVLMINDGSRDHSLEVLDKFARSDHRFCLINKKNSGVSNTRNTGIALAKGDYLQFVDSDDWLVKDAIETFVNAACINKCELIITDFYRVVGHNIYRKGHISNESVINRKIFAEYMMKAPANFYYGVMWNKFYRRDIIMNNGIRCSSDLNWCEDFLFNLEYLQYINNVSVVRKPTYYYVKTKGSIVSTQINLRQTVKTKRFLFNYYKDLYKSMDLYKENKIKIKMFYLAVAKDSGKRTKTVVLKQSH
ncbi:MAG: glycosyltransferase family 2 protein [Anaerocolumna sp.]